MDETALPALLASLLYVDFRNEELGISKLRGDIELAQQLTSAAPDEPAGELVRMLRQKWAAALPPIWNVPHHRNPHFTGREQLLHDLRNTLTAEKAAALTQAIHGLGGVGKTQLAVEYAYRFSHEYEAVWWLAAESPATLAADYAALAQPLALPEKEAADQNLAIAAVHHWLNHHDGWLLVFDNAPEVEALHDYLPQATTGHVLITSRNPNWRCLAQPFAVSTFAPEEAIDFLCKRSGKTDRDAAAKLAEALGHLPLALTQAAAYIEETGKPLADYLALYQQHRQKLLGRSKPDVDYRYTVATTWELSFQAVQRQCTAATDLLHLGAFLAPEEIPWDLLQPALSHVKQLKTSALADPLESDAAVAVLRRYSLLEVKGQSLLEVKGQFLSLHRLVQQVIQDRLPEAERAHWQETAVRLVAEVFPFDSDDVRTWPICGRLLAHALLLSEAEIMPDAVAFLCNQVGLYFQARANYAEAESLYRRSLEIREKQLGPEHPAVATSLNNLAALLESQGKSADAEPLFRRSLKIREKQLGLEHPATGVSYGNLAGVLKAQGKYADAEP
ncbi:MAG: FxSxx-COOH system tetratricopeptide repeat protein, partial [bacterium]